MSDGITDSEPLGLGISARTWDIIQDKFTYHPPTGDQATLYAVLNEAFKTCAQKMAAACGGVDHNREVALAMTHLQNARMWANASIAINRIGAAKDGHPGKQTQGS